MKWLTAVKDVSVKMCSTDLGEGEVCGLGGGVALEADDGESDVRLLDHADVVAPVADRRRHVTHLRLLHHPHQLALLQGGFH